MQDPIISSNPLVQSVVHRPFGQAVQEIGLPELPLVQFSREITQHLQGLGSHLDTDAASIRRLWQSVLRGEVIAAEVWNDDAVVFYVRGGLGSTGVDLRLVCQHHAWRIQSITSVYTRPLRKVRWIRMSAYGIVAVLTGILGYSLHRPTASEGRETVLRVAANDTQPSGGSTNTSSNSLAVTSNNSAHSAGGSADAGLSRTGSKAASDKSQPVQTSPSQTETSRPSIYTFTLQQGMPLMTLAQFLAQHHLVSDAVGFDMAIVHAGIDRNIQPGTYTFRAGMTQAELLQVLRKGPSA
ncbi:MAG: endolytic transglycosylase MltG [Alicyclobacillus sp.]|nr:endolytic transglycosylase MltG [Alicyclobacillus sp.]